MSDKKNASSSVGRDELAALLGASRASDLVAAANNDANKSSLSSAGLAPQSRRHNRKEDAEDVSKMDRAQAAALVAKKFGSGTQSSSAAAGGVARHRASGKRKRQYQLLAGDLTERDNSNNAVISSMEVEEGIDDFYDKGSTRKEEEDNFAIKSVSGGGKRKKLQAKVLLKRGGDGNDRTDRRRRSYSDSSSASSTSSSSQSQSSSSSDDESRNRSRRRNRRRRSNSSSSSSSSSDEDEADLRRKRARAKAQRNQSEAVVISTRGTKEESANNDSTQSRDKLDASKKLSDTSGKDIPIKEKIDDKKSTITKQNKLEESSTKREKHNESSSDSESSSSDDTSSSSSSSEDESDDDIAPISVSKPLFVPKSKRGTVAEVEAQQRKLEEAEERRIQEKEKRAVQSRALVAEAVSAVGKNGASSGIDDGDEFDTGEVGGEFIPVPDDSDPVDEDSPELVLAERDAWEARELIRILRDVDEAAKLEKERKELERRRALTDDERLEEDRRSGRYRAPGEARRGRKDDERRVGSKSDINYLQRYHHRGAFYLDDDTLNEAGANDVRHRALEYSRSATGDRIDKRSLPEVMQVKNFGLAGYSTKYKGLSKEDTTDKRLDFLPIRGASAGKKDEKGGNNRYNQR